MANPSPNASRLRAALEWWRTAASINRPPLEADFVTEDPHRYAGLLSDAFIVDADGQGSLTFRFVGTELSDYVGWSAPGQRIDLAAQRRELALIQGALARSVETLSPALAQGRIEAVSGAGAFETICVPLTTNAGDIAFFGVVARAGHWRLPPAPQNHRVTVEAVLDIGSKDAGSGPADGPADQGKPAFRIAASPSPREA